MIDQNHIMKMKNISFLDKLTRRLSLITKKHQGKNLHKVFVIMYSHALLLPICAQFTFL